MNIKTQLANKANYGSSRSLSMIKYIVIHYTGNDGDTDENNGKYFKNNIVKASAHYFVDDDSITQSVPDNYVAWSVGGSKYSNASKTGGGKFYKICTNTNSISIEICDDVRNGVIYPSAKTIANALELTKHLMNKYSVPKENVIRHFDVTGKFCPAYWAGTSAKNEKWKTEFWDKLADSGKKPPLVKPTTPITFKPYLVRITASVLNVRKGAGTGYGIATTVKKNQVYTIVDEKNGWGKLKSGAGWIKLSYTKKV